MVNHLIESAAADFRLVNIHAPQWLERIKQTAFCWTTSPGAICLAINKKYFQQAYDNHNVVAIVAPPSAVLKQGPEKSIVVVEKAADFFYYLHNQAMHKISGHPDNFFTPRIAKSATIAETAIIGKHVAVGENVSIGHGCIILDHTVIGSDTVVGPKCTIGVDGFFSKRINGRKEHLKHFGGIRIGSNCLLHSGITISRSVNYGEYTEIKDSVHIGHKSVIGHDCSIGQGTDISVMAIIAGRVTIGKDCWIGAKTSISNACQIAEGASVRIGSVVITDVPANAEVSGNFAVAHQRNLSRFLKERKN